MKCSQCGKKFENENKICPHCGCVHHFDDIKLPKELLHLSASQLQQRLFRQTILKKNRYYILLLIGLLILSMFSFRFFTGNKTVTQIPNFHDDLIENTSSNALGNNTVNLVNGGLLLQYGNDMYACDINGITKISLSLDKKETILNENASYLNASDNGIYYINTLDNVVCFYDFTTKATTKLNIQASQLTSVGNYLYYLETNNSRAIYQLNKTTMETKKMTQSECVQFKIIGDWLYFTTDNAFYQMPVLGGEIMKIADEPYNHFVVDNQKIYYLHTVTNRIWSIKKDGSEKTMIVDSDCNCFLLSNQYLFYAKTDGGLFKQNLETGEVSIITQEKASRLHLAGTWIYYLTSENEGRFVSIDENSETITPVDIIQNQE